MQIRYAWFTNLNAVIKEEIITLTFNRDLVFLVCPQLVTIVDSGNVGRLVN